MPTNTALPSVELVIPSEKFFDAMSDIGKWLAGEHITSPCSTCRRNHAGDLNLCMMFDGASEAANFAARFAGRLAD
jgi:hypothetical protein